MTDLYFTYNEKLLHIYMHDQGRFRYDHARLIFRDNVENLNLKEPKDYDLLMDYSGEDLFTFKFRTLEGFTAAKMVLS